jgi:Bacteriophage clamp loader A subunit
MYELKDYLNSINYEKKNLMDGDDNEWERKYAPFIINRCLSGFIDTVLLANEMNMNSHLDKKLQYDFFINIVRPKKRFSPWLKKEKLNSLELVKEYYGYSDEKAKTALKILSEEQLEFIKSKLKRGGKK